MKPSCIKDYIIDADVMPYGGRMAVFADKIGHQACNLAVTDMQAALDAQYGLLQYRVWAHGTMRYVDKRLTPELPGLSKGKTATGQSLDNPGVRSYSGHYPQCPYRNSRQGRGCPYCENGGPR